MDANLCARDRQQAQERLRTMADLAVRYLDAAKLDALSLTIAAYLDKREEQALPRLIEDRLASEQMKPLALALLH